VLPTSLSVTGSPACIPGGVTIFYNVQSLIQKDFFYLSEKASFLNDGTDFALISYKYFNAHREQAWRSEIISP